MFDDYKLLLRDWTSHKAYNTNSTDLNRNYRSVAEASEPEKLMLSIADWA
jgi:hypothetical protein